MNFKVELFEDGEWEFLCFTGSIERAKHILHAFRDSEGTVGRVIERVPFVHEFQSKSSGQMSHERIVHSFELDKEFGEGSALSKLSPKKRKELLKALEELED
jgi:hypothetical protein